MRTGNISSLTERDWAGVRERRAFEQAEHDAEVLAQNQAAYSDYVQIVSQENQRLAPAHRIAPIPFDAWRAYADPAISDPILRGAKATNEALLRKVRTDEAAQEETERNQAREACRRGQPDTNHWKIPAGAAGLKMTIEQATAFAREQGKQFVENNPEYFPSAANVAAVTKYLTAQNVTIPTEECLKLAWLRLRELGLIEERPVPVLEPEPLQELSETVHDETELVDGFDLETGEPRQYSQKEIWKMSSADLKKAFKMWADRDTDRRPRFTKSYFG